MSEGSLAASLQSGYMGSPVPAAARSDRGDELKQLKRRLKVAEREVVKLQKELAKASAESGAIIAKLKADLAAATQALADLQSSGTVRA